MALLTSVVVLVIGTWFHRRRDRPILAARSSEVFTRPGALAYLVAVVAFWLANAVVAVVQLSTGRSQFVTDDPAVVVPGLIALCVAVLVVLRTAHALDAQDADLRGPLGQLGRFLRVGYGTAAVAAVQYLRGRTYP